MTADQIFPWAVLAVFVIKAIADFVTGKRVDRAHNAEIKSMDALIQSKQSDLDSKDTSLESKQSEIEALKQQIDTLQLLTSPEVLKHYKATKEMLEESIDLLEQDKQSKSHIIADLQTQSQVDQEKLQEMEMLRLKSDTLAKALKATQSSLSHTVSLLERAFAGRKKGYAKLTPQPKEPDNGNASDDTIPRST